MKKQRDYQAGDLDRELTWLRRDRVVDEYGQERSASFVAVAGTIPCGIDEGTGKEGDEKKGEVSTQTDTVVIRYNPDIKTTDRVAIEGTTYDIIGAKEGPGRRQWTLLTVQNTDILNTES